MFRELGLGFTAREDQGGMRGIVIPKPRGPGGDQEAIGCPGEGPRIGGPQEAAGPPSPGQKPKTL